VVAGEHDVERDDQAGAGQHLDADHQDDEELASGEAVLRERDGRQEGKRHRDRDDDEHDDEAVLHIGPEVRRVDRVGEVMQRRRRREPGRSQAVDLVVRLERGRDHPEDREDHHDEEDDADGVPAAATEDARGQSTSPILTMRRT
jgi:hypothetical protein